MHYRPEKVGWECTARAKYTIYDCLVYSFQAVKVEGVDGH